MAQFNNPDTCKKVYINPNFNKPQVNNLTSSSVMHVNPKFSHLLSHVQATPNVQNKNRIYVNPNFMKSTSSTVKQTEIYQIHQSFPYCNEETTKGRVAAVPPVAKSRYSLVRRNLQESAKTVEKSAARTKSTIKVNKYKSIQLNDIKRNLDNIKTCANDKSLSTHVGMDRVIKTDRLYLDSSNCNANRNKFKLVNTEPIIRNDMVKARTYINTVKRIPSNQATVKKIKGNFKKNNIPCPMFKKFGKCLRQTRGRCDFLHDKKHVSICRKFIKGLCHDRDCLLSHDLTTKKMPTCYFYLQGTCTKQDCPYLHIKLSEKVKICPDFLKGYCEKGSNCLQRHIDIRAQKGSTLEAKSFSTLKRKYIKIKVKNNDRNESKVIQSNEKQIVIDKNENKPDYRYYQDLDSENNATEQCEIIKPMRCKLGTLPSFIQL